MPDLSLSIPEFVADNYLPCATASPDIFFAEDIEDENGKLVKSVYSREGEAKTLCLSCPVRVQCLVAALENNAVGIWGGTTEAERKTIRRYRKDPASIPVRMVGKRSKRK